MPKRMLLDYRGLGSLGAQGALFGLKMRKRTSMAQTRVLKSRYFEVARLQTRR